MAIWGSIEQMGHRRASRFAAKLHTVVLWLQVVRRRKFVRKMMKSAWDGYEKHAWGQHTNSSGIKKGEYP